MFGIGSMELLVIMVVALLVFGSKQLPDVARQIGKGLRDLQRATQDARNEINKMMEDDNNELKG